MTERLARLDLVEVLDLVGPVEVAERLGVPRGTVRQWRWRKVMPEPLAICSGVPVWHYPTIAAWYERRRGGDTPR